MSNSPTNNVPASEPAVQGYSLSDEPSHATSDPTSVPLPKSPEISEPQAQSLASATARSGSYDGPNPFNGPSEGLSSAGIAEPASPGGASRPGETVLSYSPPVHEQDFAPPPGPPPANTRLPIPETASAPTTPATGGDEAIYATNSQLASLHAIFPDFDAEMLQSVLESVGGDQDRAVDTLLGMSDPEHVSTSGPEAQTHPQQVRSIAIFLNRV